MDRESISSSGAPGRNQQEPSIPEQLDELIEFTIEGYSVLALCVLG